MFRALRTDRSDGGISTTLVELDDDALPGGDVTIDVEYSSVNYKDGLAITGRPGVIRRYPLTPGIDLVGSVAASASPRWAVGDRVVLNGWGVGEKHDGGLAERARVDGEWLQKLPEGMSPRRAAAIGTAGFTAMLAVLALERHGIGRGDGKGPGRSDGAGEVLVTGASGGVGSFAVALLAALGHRVVVSTGRVDEERDHLVGLGAVDLIRRSELGDAVGKPLQPQRWAAAVDSVGSTTLANVLAQTRYGGIVASCGLAQGADLPGTVMPFILRAVTLAGINSVEAPRALRDEAWARLADLDPAVIDGLTTETTLDGALGTAEDILAGRVRGRVVVDVRR